MPTETTTPPLCFGAEDEKGQPTCEGPNRRPVLVSSGGWHARGYYCDECRALAIDDGYVVVDSPE